ncbi:hypothetical protein BJX61DRAFT_544718 [Aspergillus egyptiacus]|nr:hypothetical protein BJX61DRAFT_544718 [Aspergillus egyptiacus]
MDISSITRRSSTGEAISPGSKRPRIRPSRGRGLRSSTGCLTCRERRVKCDDGKPRCMRCTKSNRICRYAPAAHQRRPTASDESPGARSDPRKSRTEAERDPSVGLESPRNSDQPQPDVETAAYVQPTYPPPADAGPLQLNGSLETPQDDQSLSSLDPAFSTSPLGLSQIPLLNISPFEWYDLLARDAINDIQRWNEASAGPPRWNFPEITLSRRQTPAPECAESRHDEGRLASHHRGGGTEGPSLDYHPLSEPWNSDDRIALSTVDFRFLRYYTEVVGPILDLFDPARHFTNVVPHLGLRNIGLLKSILAVGAKHMSLGLADSSEGDGPSPTSPAASARRSSEPDLAPAHMAAQYYYETLHYLSQTLLYPSYADSREILATSIMISTYEMFDADRASTRGDWERHLRGSFWIQRSQDNDGESADGLRRAVWWAWLRQDIWAAFQAGRPTLTIWRPRKKLEQLDPDELATRIVYLCAKCVAFAASDKTSPSQDPRHRIEQGDRLLRALDDWKRVLPDSYQPVTVAMDSERARGVGQFPSTSPHSSSWSGTVEQSPGRNTVFPPVWIHPASHAGAMQMYHFAKCVVLLNQPTMGGLQAYRQRERQLSESVQMVCGIANACQEHDSAVAFVSVQTLFGVGQFVQSSEMRVELLRTLENMMRISKFPAKGLVDELQTVWQG